MRELMRLDAEREAEENGGAATPGVPSSSTAPRQLAEIRAQIAASYDDGAPELMLIVDLMEASRIHMGDWLEECDRNFSVLNEQLEGVIRRLRDNTGALVSSEGKLADLVRLLAETAGNQQKQVDAMERASTALDRQTAALEKSLGALRQGGPFSKAMLQLLPLGTFLAGAAALYFTFLWMR